LVVNRPSKAASADNPDSYHALFNDRDIGYLNIML
jgi:hypothetical protein